ncbi:MAG: sulfatase-like hydrolase/transferase [Draconibacterium sp.]|nr:sulfatase-like hydrolase/transferase [Draconibacterium sp.]
MINYLLLLLLSNFLCCSKPEKDLDIMTSDKPNILLIITDQQTATSLSCTGNKYVKTPALDKLADSGVRFERNYVVQPLCLPFRSSLQTGRYPHEIGTINNGEKIKGEFPFLGNLVATAGYKCDYIGKWHVGVSPEKAGYIDYDNVGTDDKKAIVAEDYLLQKHDKPFFLTVSFMNPHNICELARADAIGTELPDGAIGLPPTDLNDLPPLPDNFDFPKNEPSIIRTIQKKSKVHYPTSEWSELTWRQYLCGYYRLVEKVDAEIGKVLEALKKGGHDKNTVVIFTSDHGEGVAMHHWNQKQILYEQSTRVPLILNWKGITQKQVNVNLVSNALDIPATILELAEVKKPDLMHGISLVPIMKGKSIVTHEFVISETMFARGGTNLGATGRMVRTEKFKYCIYDNGEKREQLFNMENDPGEMNNLVYTPEFSKELNRHRKLIIHWAKETDDN